MLGKSLTLGLVTALARGGGAQTPFVTVWDTTNTSIGSSNSDQIALPLVPNGTYNFVVDWGDGNQDTITAYDQAEATHTYAVSGEYTVMITGTCYGVRFANTGDRLKLLDIQQWGNGFRLGNTGNYFWGCNNLQITATDILDLSGTTRLDRAFFFCTSLTNIPGVNSWDVSGITNMGSVFRSSAFNGDISGWDVSGATTMTDMFQSNTAFNQDIGAWDVSSVTNMVRMFQSATAFNQDIGAWYVGNVTDMTNMFLNIALSTPNYDALLVGWESLSPALQDDVIFNGGNSQYSAGAAATARANLIANHNWSIADGGQAA